MLSFWESIVILGSDKLLSRENSRVWLRIFRGGFMKFFVRFAFLNRSILYRFPAAPLEMDDSLLSDRSAGCSRPLC